MTTTSGSQAPAAKTVDQAAVVVLGTEEAEGGDMAAACRLSYTLRTGWSTEKRPWVAVSFRTWAWAGSRQMSQELVKLSWDGPRPAEGRTTVAGADDLQPSTW